MSGLSARTNFHSIADLATSSNRVADFTKSSQSTADSVSRSAQRHDETKSLMKVKMEPSPTDSLQTPELCLPHTSAIDSSHRPRLLYSPASSDDSGYGGQGNKASRVSDEDDTQFDEDLAKSDKMRKYRKQRTVFETSQLKMLEDTFAANAYPSSEEYETLSAKVNIDEGRLRIWFQNRRARYRRSAKHCHQQQSHYQPFLSAHYPIGATTASSMMSHLPQSGLLMLPPHQLLHYSRY